MTCCCNSLWFVYSVFFITIITSEQLILHLSLRTGSRLVRESAAFKNVASWTFARWSSSIAFEIWWDRTDSLRKTHFLSAADSSEKMDASTPTHHPPLQSPDAHEPTAAAEDKGEESKGSLGGKFCIMKRSLSHHPALSKKNHTLPARRRFCFCACYMGSVSPQARGASPTSLRAHKQSFWNRAKTTDGQYQVFFVFFFNKRDKAPRFHFAAIIMQTRNPTDCSRFQRRRGGALVVIKARARSCGKLAYTKSHPTISLRPPTRRHCKKMEWDICQEGRTMIILSTA